ncbi:MAG: aspartate aminotransferase family protein [Bacteroidales bacterium]|nr:aspartate aminotransferase family protein [Bacteroidales bacterium]
MDKNHPRTGDMAPEEFRQYGYKVVDWITEYLMHVEEYPVLSQVSPGDIKSKIPTQPPQKGENMADMIRDLDEIIMPGITHWNHPNFMAYFNSTASAPGILAEMFSAALNVNGMLWKTSPAVTELEDVTLDWFRQMLGFPKDFWGIIYDTASVSSMHAIAAAREQAVEFNFRQKGMAGRGEVPRLRLYCTEHSHSSIDKGALAMGIGMEGIRKIPVDGQFRMIPEALQNAIEEDRGNGWYPFCVVATVGTTSSTSIDPVDAIGDICNKENIWLHVDGAYGGVAAVLPEMRTIFKGIEKADSVVVNPHKWMFTPIDLSVFFTQKPEVLKRAFSLVAEYLKTGEGSSVQNYMDYGIQLGRRFRSLKLWFIIRYFGVEGIQNRIKEHLNLAKWLKEEMAASPDFELMAPVPFSVVCFRFHPDPVKDVQRVDELNEKLMNNINATGELFLSHTKLNNQLVLRVAISGIRTERHHVEKAWKLIRQKSQELL